MSDDELQYLLNWKLVHQESSGSGFGNIVICYFREQIAQYDNSVLDRCRYEWSRIQRDLNSIIYLDYWYERLFTAPGLNVIIEFTKKIFCRRQHTFGKRPALCVIPLPHFLSYNSFPEDRCPTVETTNNKNSQNTIPNKLESAFIRLTQNQSNNNIFRHSDALFNIMLQYKWDRFVWMYFLLMYIICVIFYISFMVGVSFSASVFGYQPGSNITNSKQIACISLCFFSNTVLIFQELRQMRRSFDKRAYFTSVYNLVDWATFLLPIATFITLLTGASGFVTSIHERHFTQILTHIHF